MNDEKVFNGPNGQRMGLGNKTVDQKPIFTVSPSTIFVKLHHNAQQKALEVINTKNQNVEDINKIIINTALSDNGRTLSKTVNASTGKDGSIKANLGLFRLSHIYEIGIVFQATKFPNLANLSDDEKEREQEIKNARNAIEDLKNLAMNGINTYFKWFAGNGDDGHGAPQEIKFSLNDIETFEPSYNGGEIRFENYMLVANDDDTPLKRVIGSSDKSNRSYNKDREDQVYNIHAEHGYDEGQDYRPRVGFKVKYKIVE